MKHLYAFFCLFHLFSPVVYNKKRINIFYLSFTVKENEIRHCQSQCLILIYKSLFCFLSQILPSLTGYLMNMDIGLAPAP